MEVSEFLKNAKALIDTPEKWTTGTFARDRSGKPLTEDEFDSAACFCSLGAMRQARQKSKASDVYWDARDALTEALHDRGAPGDVAFFNDSHTHAEVLALFDDAIARTAPRG